MAPNFGVSKRIEGSQFRFTNIKWQGFLYIVYRFGDIWVRMINLTLLLRSSKARCYGNLLIFGAINVLD